MPTDQQAFEIMAAFQRYAKSGDVGQVANYEVAALKQADIALGGKDLDQPFRIALRNRINELEDRIESKHQSAVRVVGYIVTFSLGVLATLLAEWLLRK